MKTAICYLSCHHGNTRKVVEAMAKAGSVDLIDLRTQSNIRLDGYDCVGFASGIYMSDMHKTVVEFARQHLPTGKPVFFVYTYGGAKGRGTKTLRQVAEEKECPVLGEFSCKGYDTFGPFKLVGGLAKGHPNAKDLEKAQQFYCSLFPQPEPEKPCTSWKFETSGPTGLCRLFGVDIYQYRWQRCEETATVIDPHYHVEKVFPVYKVEIDGVMHRFAAGEFSNGVSGFYLPEE